MSYTYYMIYKFNVWAVRKINDDLLPNIMACDNLFEIESVQFDL